MKKNIILFSSALILLSLIVFSLLSWKKATLEDTSSITNNIVANDTIEENNKGKIFEDFIYDVGPRFGGIKKSELDKMTQIEDFISKKETQSIKSLKSVNIIIIKGERQSEIQEIGYSNKFTAKQLELLHSLDYSSNFNIRAEYLIENKETGVLENSYSSPHHTIVPEKQAEYKLGKIALKKYLKDNSLEARKTAKVDPMKLQPAKLYFTINTEGELINVRLDKTSNYPLVDKKMIQLIKNLPGEWIPAENYKGEKVNQELVVSFGLMGC